MKRLLTGAISILFITAAAAFAKVGSSSTAAPPISPKEIQVKAESLKNNIEGI